MLKTLRSKAQAGFTIIELLIVIAIIGILAGLVLNNFQGAQAKSRDTARRTDINAIHGKLEEFYNEHGGYPNEVLSTTIFPGIDAQALIDSDGGSNDIEETFTTSTTKPTPSVDNSNEYEYAGYGCGSGTAITSTVPPAAPAQTCTKYVLSTFLEKDAAGRFDKDSLN